ncbi:hypothetical protein [Patiriisocius sp. Uisw_017]|jgi:hypothetical protein|uniref:hypothetical protein n=1 Tax=Patiriisocius sp. Uisw_017 TaxID=3230968 RepID=UPI0039E7D54F
MKYLILLLLLTGLVHSCNESDDEFNPTLPLITQTGANTFGCYVDGVLVTPRNGATSTLGPARGMIFSGNPPSSEFEYSEINVQDYKSNAKGIIDVHIPDLSLNGEGTYIIEDSNCLKGIFANNTVNIRCLILKDLSQPYTQYCSIANSGELFISRYDFENRIISGTFSCQAVNQEDSSDIIEITQGRFDIKWDVLNTNIIDFP